MSDVEQLMDEHRKMVVLSGKLSDFQLKNLNAWPFVVFEKDSIKEISIDYNFTEKDDDGEHLNAGQVTYLIDFNDKLFYTKKQVMQRTEEISKWVKHLFWEDTKVSFKITTANGERIDE